MTKVAFVFPGQGSQAVGMGSAVYNGSALAQEVFHAAEARLSLPLRRLCFEGPEEALRLTEHAQPALVTTSVALLRALGAECDMAAGHSLGEYSAYVAAGGLQLGTALGLVRARGQFMQAAVAPGQGAMAAVMRVGALKVRSACEATPGIVEPANYNSAQQTVIAGEAAAVAAACERLTAVEATVRPLQVSAPFHCSLMAPARARLQPLLEACEVSTLRCPVYTNVDALPVTGPAQIRTALIRQVTEAVRWQQTIEAMIADGAGLFVEIGHGEVLGGLISRINRRVKRVSVQGPEDFAGAREAIAQARACAGSTNRPQARACAASTNRPQARACADSVNEPYARTVNTK